MPATSLSSVRNPAAPAPSQMPRPSRRTALLYNLAALGFISVFAAVLSFAAFSGFVQFLTFMGVQPIDYREYGRWVLVLGGAWLVLILILIKGSWQRTRHVGRMVAPEPPGPPPPDTPVQAGYLEGGLEAYRVPASGRGRT